MGDSECEISLEPLWDLLSKIHEIFFDFVHLIIFFEFEFCKIKEDFTER